LARIDPSKCEFTMWTRHPKVWIIKPLFFFQLRSGTLIVRKWVLSKPFMAKIYTKIIYPLVI
jgi:hypothetical protein